MIPKSSSAARQQENLNSLDFELTAAETARIDGLNINLRYNGRRERKTKTRKKKTKTNEKRGMV